MSSENDFWTPRRCFKEPVAAIFFAQGLLDAAVDAHSRGHTDLAAELIRKADLPEIEAWTNSIWSWGPNKQTVLRVRVVPGAPPRFTERSKARMPPPSVRRAVVQRDGWHCRFCGIPVIEKEVREAIRAVYPEPLRWLSNRNKDQHFAFQCMWAQFDHVVPYARGGDNSPENVILTCAPCNFGRADYLLEEVGLIDPRTRPIIQDRWEGLRRFMGAGAYRLPNEIAVDRNNG